MFRKLVVGFLLIATLLLVVPVEAQNYYGLKETASKSGYQEEDIYTKIGSVVSIALGTLAIIFFGLAVFAGIRWMTARGSEEYVTKSKEILYAAVTGLIIILGAYAFSNFVLKKLGSPGAGSGGGQTNTSTPQGGGADVACNNGSKDGLETDVDCGGSCTKCATGKSCAANKDCFSDVCSDGKCGAGTGR
jgi:hypothetical protein